MLAYECMRTLTACQMLTTIRTSVRESVFRGPCRARTGTNRFLCLGVCICSTYDIQIGGETESPSYTRSFGTATLACRLGKSIDITERDTHILYGRSV